MGEFYDLTEELGEMEWRADDLRPSCLVTETADGARTVGGLILDDVIREGTMVLFSGEDEIVKVVAIGCFSILDSNGRTHQCDAVVDVVIA